MPGMPVKIVKMKKSRQPMASAITPATGPASTRGRVNRLESSAYCVAEKRFWVRRRSRTPKAPLPSPAEPSSNAVAAYITGRLGPTWATTAYPRFEKIWKNPKIQRARPEAEAIGEEPAEERFPRGWRRGRSVAVATPTSTGAEADLDQERPGEGLGEVVAQLVENDEGQDLEGAVLAEEAHERSPHRIAQRGGAEPRLLGLRRPR